jgi:hypothetical protein
MGGGRVGKIKTPNRHGVMLRIGKAKTSTKITFVAVLRLKPPNRRRPRIVDSSGECVRQLQGIKSRAHRGSPMYAK